MKLRNNASVAQALISLAGAFEDVAEHGCVAGGLLARAPGDGALRVLKELAWTLGLRVVELRASVLENDPEDLDVRARSVIDFAMSGHKPVLVLIDEAHGAAAGILNEICSHVMAVTDERPSLVLAVCTSAAEQGVAEDMAAGLDRPVESIAIHRTADENQRLIRRIVEAME